MAGIISQKEMDVFREFCTLQGMDFNDFFSPNPPDFVKNDRTLSIELTEYHKDPSENGSIIREKESNLDKLIGASKRYYESTYSAQKIVYLSPISNTAYPINFSQASHEIAQFVAVNDGNFDFPVLPRCLQKYFSHISIHDVRPDIDQVIWQRIEAAIMNSNPDSIKDLVKAKESKIGLYRFFAPTVWLLIYSSGPLCIGKPGLGNPSTCGIITADIEQLQLATPFDKVFFFDRDNQKAHSFILSK